MRNIFFPHYLSGEPKFMRNIFFPHYLSGEPVKARHKNYQENMPYRPRLQRNEENTDKRQQ